MDVAVTSMGLSLSHLLSLFISVQNADGGLRRKTTPPQLAIRNTLGGPDTQFLIFRDSENGFPR